MLFITLMTTYLIQRKRKIHIQRTLGSRVPQGHRLGDERLEVLVLLVAPGELPRVGRN